MTRAPRNLPANADFAAVQRYLDQIARWARSSQAPRRLFSQRRRRARRKAWTMSLNLTPMIDLVFLLLFFFLVVSRFGALEGVLPTQIPTRSPAIADEVPRTPIRVRLTSQPGQPAICRVTIDRFNETPLELSALLDALMKIRNLDAGFDQHTPVHLIAGDDVAWDHVVNAYNAAFAAQYTRIYFAGPS